MAELAARIPAWAGDPWLELEVCEGRLGSRGHDPAPELPCWLLGLLGCGDSRLAARGGSWSSGGTERLVSGAHRLACWRPWDLGMEPMPGDVLVVGDRRRGEGQHSCVFVSSDGGSWTTADLEPDPRTGALRAAEAVRRVVGECLVWPSGPRRRILGWVDLGLVPYDFDPTAA